MKVFVDQEILKIFSSLKNGLKAVFPFGSQPKGSQSFPARGYAATGECRKAGNKAEKSTTENYGGEVRKGWEKLGRRGELEGIRDLCFVKGFESIFSL